MATRWGFESEALCLRECTAGETVMGRLLELLRDNRLAFALMLQTTPQIGSIVFVFHYS